MLRVLIADDCCDTADTFAHLASAWGHEALIAYDGPSALARAEALRPDVVLLDLSMPGMRGGEVARRLRAAGGPCPWLVGVTGLPPALLVREDAAPFHCRLDKPVEPARLRELLLAMEAVRRERHVELEGASAGRG